MQRFHPGNSRWMPPNHSQCSKEEGWKWTSQKPKEWTQNLRSIPRAYIYTTSLTQWYMETEIDNFLMRVSSSGNLSDVCIDLPNKLSNCQATTSNRFANQSPGLVRIPENIFGCSTPENQESISPRENIAFHHPEGTSSNKTENRVMEEAADKTYCNWC